MKLKLALLFVLISVGLHSYLALHYYDLNFNPASTEGVCNLGSSFNCDSVSTSQYSNVSGIPIALFGAVTNGVLAVLILLWILGWAKNLNVHARFTFWVSALIAATSVVMAVVSTSMSTFCIFCIAAYILSFATYGLVLVSQSKSETDRVGLANILSPANSSLLVYIVAIPVIVIFIHFSYLKSRNLHDMDQRISSSVQMWQNSPVLDFSPAAPSLSKGNDNPLMTITEFADFRCGHCRHAYNKLKAFAGSRNDVKVNFYSFPLDGTCNEAMGSGGDGISCFLAKAVYCAEKSYGKGWTLHDYFFDNQLEVNRQGTIDGVKELSKEKMAELFPDLNVLYSCVDSPEADAAIRAQAKLGENLGIRGTPTIYVNGKKIVWGTAMLPVLESAYSSLK